MTATTTTPRTSFADFSDFLLNAEVGDSYTRVEKTSITSLHVLEVNPGERNTAGEVHPETGKPLRDRMLTCETMTTVHNGRDVVYGIPRSYTSTWDTADRVGAREVLAYSDPERVCVFHSHVMNLRGNTARRVAVVEGVTRRSAKGLREAHEAAMSRPVVS